jgi:signal peptidase I
MSQDIAVSPLVLPRTAGIVAFILAGLLLISALAQQITLLPFALVPLLAGVGILRRRVWSAYGFAVFEFGQLLLLFLVLWRERHAVFAGKQVTVLAMVNIGLVTLFWFTGRSLEKAASPHGQAWPWFTVTALCTVPLLFFQGFVIPTGGMENTLLIGDHIFVETFPKPTPRRGDIVAFLYPLDRKQTFIKRVIGLPGDRIRFSNKVLYRNGTKIDEPYVIHRFPFEVYRDNFPTGFTSFPPPPPALDMLSKHVVNGEVVVPPGEYFVLGDNRDKSLDSRYWGFLDSRDIIGKPWFIYDSQDQRSPGKRWLQRERWNRLFKTL